MFVVNLVIEDLFLYVLILVSSSLLHSLCIKDCRFLIMLVRLVPEGGFASHYGIVWAIWMCGMGVMLALVVPKNQQVKVKM